MEQKLAFPAEMPLPPPLKVEEQNDIISKLGTAYDSEARSILVEHNLLLVGRIARRFSNTNAEIEDLASIGTIGLIKAVNTFDPRKNIKLVTYAARCIENEILMYIRRSKKTSCEVSLEEPLYVGEDGSELTLRDTLGAEEDDIVQKIEAKDTEKLLHEAISKLSEQEQLIVRLRFGFGGYDGHIMSQREVAVIMGVSQPSIFRKERAIMERLKEDLLQVGLDGFDV